MERFEFAGFIGAQPNEDAVAVVIEYVIVVFDRHGYGHIDMHRPVNAMLDLTSLLKVT